MRGQQRLCLGLILIILVALVGCAQADAYKQIKSDPHVMDIAVNIAANEVDCRVILKPGAVPVDMEKRAQEYVRTVAKAFRGKNVTVTIAQDDKPILAVFTGQ